MIRQAYAAAQGQPKPRLDVLCDCQECQGRNREKLAELRDGILVVKARRHGREHEVRISVDEIVAAVLKSP